MPNEKLRIAPQPAVVCEQVRVEDNGKHLLIGVYPSNILVQSFPSQIVVALWVPFKADNPGETDVEIRGTGPDNLLMFTLSAHIQVQVPGKGALATPTFPIQLARASTIKFEVRLHGGDWVTVGDTEIMTRAEYDSLTAATNQSQSGSAT